MKINSKISFYSLLIVGAMSLSGCLANKQVEITPNHLDAELTNLMKGEERAYSDDEEAVISALLKNSPSYAQAKRQEAVEENIVQLPNNMPLYREPLFAQLVVFPYVSKTGSCRQHTRRRWSDRRSRRRRRAPAAAAPFGSRPAPA